jgi:hypothetical protein
MSSDPGLCATCRHAAVVRGARSSFWMCRRSANEPEYPRYPRLPVLRCRGHEEGEPGGTAEGDVAPTPPPPAAPQP